jgi:lactoylglutathione lyase
MLTEDSLQSDTSFSDSTVEPGEVAVLMMNLAVITVQVHDMDAAVKFYTEELGFKVQWDMLAPQFVELESDGPLLLLQLCERPVDADYPKGACVMLNLAVEDAAAEFDRLRRSGARVIHDQLQKCPAGPFFGIRDPSGNVVELIEFIA